MKSVVYIQQGPRSGIFSVYIFRNVDYILLTYSCPLFCVQVFFLIVKQKSCDLLVLIFFTLNYVQWRCVGMCVCVLCSNKGGVRRRSHTLIHQPLNRPNVMLLLQSQVITLTLFLPLHHLHFLCCSPASCQICLCC